jgi:hypothetical protein
MRSELTLDREVEIEDRLEKLAELLGETTAADVQLLIDKHLEEIAKLKRVKALLGGKTKATPKGSRLQEIKEIFIDNGNKLMSAVEIAHICDCKPQAISCAIMRATECFEKVGKTYRLKDYVEPSEEDEEEEEEDE